MSVVPKKATINEIFASEKYFIDFYQREYKWRTEHVVALLDDMFYRFEQDYDPDEDPTEENVSRYDWYYLNTYITNKYNEKTYIVDGQQRLTTLTLILIKLFHLAESHKDSVLDLVKSKICGPGISGPTFWMGQNGREGVFDALMKNADIKPTGVSQENIITNFNETSRYLDDKLNTKHKFKCFVIYFVTRIVLVNIHIDKSQDVPMVFEVINDRGERLKPYEVFKGQILGQLSKNDIDSRYHPSWKESIEPLERRSPDQPDEFFKYYFKAKYGDSEYQQRQFDGDYHRIVLSNEWNDRIGLKKNSQNVKTYVSTILPYYARLYNKIVDENVYDKPFGEYVYYNALNEQDRQYLLIVSACKLNDPDEDNKIKEVSRLFDRHFVLLQLYGCYDSSSFTEIIFELNKSIREKSLSEIKEIFNNSLFNYINEQKHTILSASNPFEYTPFRDAGPNLAIRFKRYFFARIDNFIASGINPALKLTLAQIDDVVKKTGHKTGYHIEHILAQNDENRKLFNDDEEVFQRERNRLGAQLILKGLDNISSNDETYENKLNTYNNVSISNLWNRSLRADFYSTNKDFHAFKDGFKLPFKPYDVFNATSIEERHRLLFELVKLIWYF